MKFIPSILWMSVILFCHSALGAEEKKTEEVKQVKQGNFALHGSQQPGPLVGLGENVIDKNQIQLFLFVDTTVGQSKYLFEAIPGILSGITNNFSAFINVPVAIDFKQNSHRSNGLEDLWISLEYAFFNANTKYSSDQATILAQVFFPTGSIKKNPITGFGSPSLLVASTYNKTCVDWFIFGAPGAQFTTSNDGNKIGNIYFYQLGVGRNINSVADKYIVAWMVELTGTYSLKNKVHGITDPNSGGNVVFLTPSLWYSTQHLIVQFGAGPVIAQHLFGQQNKNHYFLAANFGWTI